MLIHEGADFSSLRDSWRLGRHSTADQDATDLGPTAWRRVTAEDLPDGACAIAIDSGFQLVTASAGNYRK